MTLYQLRFRTVTLVLVIINLAISFVWWSINPPRSWGYDEFLINYSEGFVRRGFPGTILLATYQALGVPPLILLYALLITIILLITFLVFNQLRSLKLLGDIPFLLILANPTLILFATSQDTFLRKDWFISLGLLLHGAISMRIKLNTLKSRHYEIFLLLLIVYLILISLSHEVNIFFIPIHIFMILQNAKIFLIKNKSYKFICTLIASQIPILLLTIVFHGNPEMQSSMSESLPNALVPGIENHPAIEALGWSFQENLTYVALMLNFNTISFYVAIFICGPGLIFWHTLRHSLRLHKMIFTYLLFLQILLLIFGWDWGRWISLISFCLIGLIPFALPEKEPKPIKHRFKLDREYKIKNIFVKLLLITILGYIQVPSFGPQQDYLLPFSNLIRIIYVIANNYGLI
jgi:hypothetical protein